MQHRLLMFYRRWMAPYTWVWVALLMLLALAMAVAIPKVKIDASSDSLVLEGDRSLDVFRDVVKRYGAEEFLFITYSPTDGQAILSDAVLQRIERLKQDLKKVPGVSSVTTLLDVPLLYSPPVSLSTLDTGVNYVNEADTDRTLAEQEFKNSPIYRQLIYSQDGKTTAIQVNLQRDETYHRLLEDRDSLRQRERELGLNAEQRQQLRQAERVFKAYTAKASDQRQQLVAQVRQIITPYRADADIFLGGVPMIAADMISFINSDLEVFGVGILLFIVVLLSVIFRQLRWVALPLASCLLTAIVMLGILGWLDWRMTVISSNFLSLLLILTLSIAVHLIVRYRELHAANPQWDRVQLVLETIDHMAKPCLYTTMTTVVAFASLVVSGIRPVIDFGWMMTIGCLVALLLTFIIIPLGLMSLPLREADKDKVNNKPFTLFFAHLADRYGNALLLGGAAVFALSVFGISQLKVENRFIDYFHPDTEIYQGMEVIDRSLGGTIQLDVVIKHEAIKPQASQPVAEKSPAVADIAADDEFADDFFEADVDDFGASGGYQAGYWFTRQGMNEIAQVHNYLDSLEETGKVLSLATLYQVMQDITGGVDDIQLALIKKNLSDEVSQTLVAPYLDDELEEARVTVRVMETSRSLQRNELLQQVDDFLREKMGYSSDQYELTNMLVLYNNMLQSLYRSQIQTLGAVFFAITLMFIVLFRSVYVAIIAIVPNLLAAATVLGGMGLLGIPLDMMTITIASITVGIGVDDTIHYIHRFKEEIQRDGDYRATMYRCHKSIGKAMYYTSVIIVFGFSILALSNFRPSIYFGLLTGFAMLSALLWDLLVLPRLLVLLKPFGKQPQLAENREAS